MTANPDRRGSITARELREMPRLVAIISAGPYYSFVTHRLHEYVVFWDGLMIRPRNPNDDRPATAREMGGTVIEWRED